MFKKSGHDAATEQKTYPVAKTDEEWREELSPEEYAVLRKAGTERAFTGEYTDTETTGVYRCKACQAALFESDTKFHSGCGRTSFYQPMTDTVVPTPSPVYQPVKADTESSRPKRNVSRLPSPGRPLTSANGSRPRPRRASEPSME